MCLQCVVESKEVIRDIVPGYSLHIATKDAPGEWPVGHYGVVKMNDPMFVFPPLPPMPVDDDDPNWTEYDKVVSDLSARLGFSLYEGYDFTSACISAGYSPDTHGSNVLWWFFEQVHRRLNNLPAVPETLISENVAKATLNLVTTDLLAMVVERLRLGNVVQRNLELIESNYHETIQVEGKDITISGASADFFIPDVVKVLTVPELLEVYMRSTAEQLAHSIDFNILGAALNAGTESLDTIIDSDQPTFMFVTPEKFEAMKTIPGFELIEPTTVHLLIPLPIGKLNGFIVIPASVMKSSKQWNVLTMPRKAMRLEMRRARRATQVDGITIFESYAELGNFSLKVQTYFEPFTLRQRYFIDVLCVPIVMQPDQIGKMNS